MVAQLITQSPTYDGITGRFILSDGTQLSSADLKLALRGESIWLERKLLQVTDRYISGRITTEEWQKEVLRLLKKSNILAMILAAGGVAVLVHASINRQYFELLRDRLRELAIALSFLTVAILAEELTPGQVRGWMKYRASSVFGTYSTAEMLTRMAKQGANEARRSTDPTAAHCPDCPELETNGWVPIEQVTPIGVACRCNGKCRCRITYRFNPGRALGLIGKARLSDRVNAWKQNLS